LNIYSSFPPFLTVILAGDHGSVTVSERIIPYKSPTSLAWKVVLTYDPLSNPFSERIFLGDLPVVPIKTT